jgi:integrase
LSVFGTPRVENVTAPGHPLRAKAAELAVFLACHPDGADTRTVGENLEPDVRLRHADTRVHTNVSNLRHVLGRAAGPRRIGYVIKRNGRYQLDRAHVRVDLWELRDLLARAATAPPAERIELLTRAGDLYAAPLAEGCDYDWVEPYREKARQQAIDAHLLPRRGEAIGLDRSEINQRKATMTIRASSGSGDGEEGDLDFAEDHGQVTTKNQKSRTIGLDRGTLQVLRRHREHQLEHQRQLGDLYEDSGRVLTDELGRLKGAGAGFCR